MAQQQAIHKFVLGSKEVEGKQAEFQYDKGWYSIAELEGEERNVIYKSRNAQEAYMKWNVYIGRKKERPIPEERHRNDNAESGHRQYVVRNRSDRSERNDRNERGERTGRKDAGEGREYNGRRRQRDYKRDNRRQ
jgi:hypothetical protein